MDIQTIRDQIPLGSIAISRYVPSPNYPQNIPHVTEEMQAFALQHGFKGKITATLEYHDTPGKDGKTLYPLFKIEDLDIDLPLYPGDVGKDARNSWPAAWARFERMLVIEEATRAQNSIEFSNHEQVTLKPPAFNEWRMPNISPLIKEVRSVFTSYGLEVFNLKPEMRDRSAQHKTPIPSFIVEVGNRDNLVILELPNDSGQYNLAEGEGCMAWQKAFDRLILQLGNLPKSYIDYLKKKLGIGLTQGVRDKLFA